MVNRKHPARRLLALLLAAVTLTAAPLAAPAYAASSTEIKGEINDLNDEKDDIQERIDQLSDEIDDLGDEKSNALEKKAKLDEKNMLAQQDLDILQEQIDIIDNLLDNMQQDLADAREEEKLQKQRWLSRVRAMEESSGVGYLEVLFDASSFSDLLTRLDLVEEVMTYDEQLQQKYIAARENVETLEAEAEDMFVENEQRRQEMENKKAQLQTDIDAACLIIQQMEDDIDGYTEIREQEEESQKEVEELIAQKEKELKEAQAREYAAWLAAHPNAGGGGGGGGGGASTPAVDGSTWMIWPTTSRRINDYYGVREEHPVTGNRRMHYGIDIYAPSGTVVYAAAGGTVVTSGYDGSGYGNYLVINHGNGYSTLYAHLSKKSVGYGAKVKQGQIIGYSGATGAVTGAHLHFEVHNSSGTALNPLSFSYY